MAKTFSGPTQGSVHLDALRGAAALLVFINHTRALYFSSFLPAERPLLHTGSQLIASETAEAGGGIKIASAAVVIFFVLSGYLVGGSVIRALRANRWSWTSYLTKRLARLMVVLIPAVLIGAALDHLGQRSFGAGSIYDGPVGLHLTVSADLEARLRPLVLLGNMVFIQGIFVPIEGTNVSLWSLAYEFWYYIAFPLALCSAFPQFSRVTRIVSLAAAVAVLWLAGAHMSLLFPIWIMGAVVSIVPAKLDDSKARIVSIAAAIMLFLGVALVRVLDMQSIPAEYIIGLLTAVLLYCLVGQTSQARSGVYRKISGFFSDISYSLYMFHLPIAVFLCAILNTPWQPFRKTWSTLSLYVLSDLVVLGIVYLLWRAFESNTDFIRARVFRFEAASSK